MVENISFFMAHLAIKTNIETFKNISDTCPGSRYKIENSILSRIKKLVEQVSISPIFFGMTGKSQMRDRNKVSSRVSADFIFIFKPLTKRKRLKSVRWPPSGFIPRHRGLTAIKNSGNSVACISGVWCSTCCTFLSYIIFSVRFFF